MNLFCTCSEYPTEEIAANKYIYVCVCNTNTNIHYPDHSNFFAFFFTEHLHLKTSSSCRFNSTTHFNSSVFPISYYLENVDLRLISEI